MSTVSASRAAPRFTVVIPLYNKQEHIGATLASVANQSYPALEVIVVDDGSTDGSVGEVLAANIPGLRLQAQANAGPGAARNRGIAEAAGEWIAFIDADDLWLPDHLETLAALILAFPGAEFVSSGYVRARRSEMSYVLARRSACPPFGLFDFLQDHQRVHTSVIAVRTECLRNAGGFKPKWPGEDLELWTRLALEHQFALHPYVTGIYVQGTGGAMDSQVDANEGAGDDPAIRTIDEALLNECYRDRWQRLLKFRAHLLKAYTRGALFHGRSRLARAYLTSLQGQGGSAPIGYRLLARLPPPLLRAGSRLYSRIKRLLHGRKAAV